MTEDRRSSRDSLGDLYDIDIDPDLDSGRVADGAGRRLNNRSVYILFALVGAFLFVLFWVMYDKSHAPEMFKSTEGSRADDASRLADQLTFNAPTGFIKSNEPEPEPKQEPEKTKPKEEPAPTLHVPVASNLNNPPTPRISEDERRIRQLKMQKFEQALFSNTGVPVDDYASQQRSSTLRGGGGGSNYYQQDEIKARLADTRARLAQMRSSGGDQDVNKAYQERLAALQGDNNSTSNASSQSTTIGGVSEDRWLLQNNKAAQGLDPVEKPRTAYEVRSGGVIPATMISGINSDLPGQIIGQITQAVYDTATGRHLVIPQGTRLVGMYDASISYGQERVLIVWQRLIFPDGKALDLGSMPGADSAGYSGFSDQVNTHFWRTIGSALLMSVVIAGVDLSQDNYNSSSNNNQRASDSLSEALGQTLGQALAQMIQKNLNVSPTLEIRPGYRFNVIITKDIPFTKPYQSFDY